MKIRPAAAKPPFFGHRRSRGSAILEITVALAGMMILSVLLLKASLNVTRMQQWTIRQAMTDAFMTQETAIGKRLPFQNLIAGNTWPTSPTVSTETVVLGRLPGGNAITATLQRTKVPHQDNLASDGGVGDTATNPAKMETWQLQSYLSYEIAGRDYVKARSIVRSR